MFENIYTFLQGGGLSAGFFGKTSMKKSYLNYLNFILEKFFKFLSDTAPYGRPSREAFHSQVLTTGHCMIFQKFWKMKKNPEIFLMRVELSSHI